MEIQIKYTHFRFSILLVLALLSADISAQSKKVSFVGAGRMQINSGKIGGSFLDQDTLTARRELSGYALFDLGFDIRPNDQTEILAVTRVTSDLDGFWGAGNTFLIRTLYARGLIKNAVRYQVGDINYSHTPYTLFSPYQEFGAIRSSALQIFNDIIDYENFYERNTWRQQGAQVEFGLTFPKGIEELNFHGMVAKNRQTDYFSTPDRLFTLLNLGVVQSKYARFRFNYAEMFEIEETAQFSESNGQQVVKTIDFEGGPENALNLKLAGEIGMSNVYYRNIDGAPADTAAGFVDLSLKGNIEKLDLDFKLGYRSVASGFRSPGAQSRRIAQNPTPQSFTFLTNQEIRRPLQMADIITDFTVYDQQFSPALGGFLPQYDNVTPYGRATPNRQGVDLRVERSTDSSFVSKAYVEAAYLTEGRGQGTPELRNFMSLKAGSRFDFKELLDLENGLNLDLILSHQTTSRDGLSGISDKIDGIGSIDLTSTFAEAGITWEAAEQIDLLGGGLFLIANGNEFEAQRNEFNEIDFYNALDIDLEESMLYAGFRYRFSDNIQMTIQYHRINWTDNLRPELSYNVDQVLFLYNMFF